MGAPLCLWIERTTGQSPTIPPRNGGTLTLPLAFVVNPHAPSGHLTAPSQLAKLASEFPGVLLVDEAYVDFVDPERKHDAVALVRQHDNVIVLRTLSKGYSLAGLRLGYGLACPSLIEPMVTKTRDSYNVNALAQRAGAAAIAHRSAAQTSWLRVRADRARLIDSLVGLGMVVTPSEANFVLAQVPGGIDAAAVAQELERQRILVRHFGGGRLADKLRITVGTPEDSSPAH